MRNVDLKINWNEILTNKWLQLKLKYKFKFNRNIKISKNYKKMTPITKKVIFQNIYK